jgi:citrate lyase beta subunit
LFPKLKPPFSVHIPFSGATSSKDAQDILYARQKIVVVAKAFGLQAIDLVYIDFRDGDGLLRQSREGAAMGFTGMTPDDILESSV